MPHIDSHVKTSIGKTGKEYREVHEWLDADPDKKAERHDITKIYEHGAMIKERFGEEGLAEYLQHINDDVAAKFEHAVRDMEKTINDTLAYFGVRRG